MKKLILRFFTFVAILYVIDNLIKPFDFDRPSSLYMLAATLSFFSLIIKPVIQFFTIPLNFFTFGLFNFVISCAALYVFKLLIGGFKITNGYLGSINSNDVDISEIKLSSIAVLIVSALFISLLNNLINWTQGD